MSGYNTLADFLLLSSSIRSMSSDDKPLTASVVKGPSSFCCFNTYLPHKSGITTVSTLAFARTSAVTVSFALHAERALTTTSLWSYLTIRVDLVCSKSQIEEIEDIPSKIFPQYRRIHHGGHDKQERCEGDFPSMRNLWDCPFNSDQMQEHVNALIPGHQPWKFPAQKCNRNHCRSRCHTKKSWTTVINLLKWSEVLQREGFCFHSW